MPVETPVRRRRRVRHRPRLIPCLLALVAVLLVIKWIDPFAPGERPLPETPDWITVELLPLNEFSRPGTPLEEVNGIVISEQAVFPQPFRPRPQGDVLGVTFHALHPIPIRFQRQRDECGRRCFCRV